jgi:hypothetical protein
VGRHRVAGSTRKVDLKTAAELLGSTTEAVRKRAKRGTIDSETGEDGRIYVWVDDTEARVDDRVDSVADQVDDRVDDTAERVDGQTDGVVERMASEIDHLREQLREERAANRENRRLLAAALERIPAIEAPLDTPSSEASDSRVTDAEPRSGTQVPEQEKPVTEEPEQRSWWRRFFGL